MPPAFVSVLRTAALAAFGLAVITSGYLALHVASITVVAMTYLTLVLAVATTAGVRAAVGASVAAMACLNYFFIPPEGTFRVADPENLAALVAFLAVSVVASHLATAARARAGEANARRDELTRLFDLTRDILYVAEGPDALDHVARFIAQRFRFEQVLVCVAGPRGWAQHGPVESSRESEDRLNQMLARSRAALEFDAHTRTYAGHEVHRVAGGAERALVPIRRGADRLGVLVTQGTPCEPGTRDAIAGVAAMAIERLALLDARRQAEGRSGGPRPKAKGPS